MKQEDYKMGDSINHLNLRELIEQDQDQNENLSVFNEQKNEEELHNITLNTSREERYFIHDNETNSLLNKKRENNSTKIKKSHNKYAYDNLKRECKHLVIESAEEFINRKIIEVYNGDIDKGILKKKLFKLNQSVKKNSRVEFNQLLLNKTLKEILSEKITKKIKFYEPDHNKKVIEQLIEEKRDEFESLFNITFIECLEHFIGIKQIDELNGLILFKDHKEQIIQKYEEDGELYYQNLEIFLKEFEQRINNAKPKNHKKVIKSKK